VRRTLIAAMLLTGCGGIAEAPPVQVVPVDCELVGAQAIGTCPNAALYSCPGGTQAIQSAPEADVHLCAVDECADVMAAVARECAP
jgi:hypothetical protein